MHTSLLSCIFNIVLKILTRKHHTTDTETKEFLYVHQTAWQKQMLNKYGNHLFLLDATYKTSRYSLPLFFLCVKTNVNYQIVGSFIIQRETQISIFEALQILSSWNPGWIPSNAMCDFSNEEIKAIEELFPGKLSACFWSRFLPFLLIIKIIRVFKW